MLGTRISRDVLAGSPRGLGLSWKDAIAPGAFLFEKKGGGGGKKKKGGGGVGKHLSAAPTKRELKRLAKKLEEKRQGDIQLSILEDERDATHEAMILGFTQQELESQRREETMKTVYSWAPWVLGGVGLLLAGGVALVAMKRRKR